jgi:hypothetical protein
MLVMPAELKVRVAMRQLPETSESIFFGEAM